jgi:hypothetical protein
MNGAATCDERSAPLSEVGTPRERMQTVISSLMLSSRRGSLRRLEYEWTGRSFDLTLTSSSAGFTKSVVLQRDCTTPLAAIPRATPCFHSVDKRRVRHLNRALIGCRESGIGPPLGRFQQLLHYSVFCAHLRAPGATAQCQATPSNAAPGQSDAGPQKKEAGAS